MTELEQKIQEASNAYYKDGSSPYTDDEFDALMAELKRTQPNSILLENGVQEELKGIKKKYKLWHTMGTLAKAMNETEFEKLWNNYCEGKEIICQKKIDGGGILLHYWQGKLIQALSRGDTEYGEDLTENIKKISDVVQELPVNFTGEIRGEFFMKRSVFNKYFKDSAKNPRNMAAGIIKRLDGSDCDKLNFIAYDLWKTSCPVRADCDLTELNKLTFLKEVGFVIPSWWAGISKNDILDLRNQLNTNDEIPCDGLVIKQNKTDKEDLERRTPMYNFAFKPETTIKITKIKKIIWQLAGSQLAPVAIVEPVELCGATVERASLSNVNIMNQLGAYENALVEIKRSGEIIPSVVKVLEPKENAFEIPKNCPVCGDQVEVNESGIPICINKDCPRKLSHRFSKMFDILGVKGCGKAFLNNLENECSSVEEFIKLILNEDSIIDKWAGGINGRKIVKQFKSALNKEITIPQFLAMFDYKGFDEKKLKSINEINYNITEKELQTIDGFGEITSKMFIDFLNEYKNEIENLKKYFRFKKIEEKTGALKGLTFCFTGAAIKPRMELQEIVEKNGGINKTSVTKKLSYLVNDDVNSMTSKNIKAKELGVPIISSVDFLNMVES